MEPGSITFDICKKTVDKFVLVTEEEIADAIRLMLEHHYILIEGAAALSVAAFMQIRKEFKDKTVVLIISGRKITLDKLKKIIC